MKRSCLVRGLVVGVGVVMSAWGCTAGVTSTTGGASSSSSSSSTGGASVTVSTEVGPEGGTVSVEGAVLVIPAGALSTVTTITLERTTEAAPAGFVAHSPIFRCSPNGLSFATPATMTLTHNGTAGGVMHWSRGADGAFTALATTEVDSARASAPVSHFSRGFIGVPLP